MPTPDIKAEVLLPTQELRDDLPFYTGTLGMRLETIYPADNPSVASLSGHGLRLRIEKGADVPPGRIRILTDDPDSFADGQRRMTAPNGTEIEVDRLDQLAEALEHGAKSVLLDNFDLPRMRAAVAMAGERAELEVSGGVGIEQLRDIAATGVHRISIGRLTKDVTAVDFSMRVV